MLAHAEDRAQGKFPISIATCLAIEGALGVHDNLVKPKTPPIMEVHGIMFNLSTVFRNFYGALKPDALPSITVEAMANAMIAELLTIAAVVHEQTRGRVRAHFYWNHYESLPALMHYAKFKPSKTPKQMLYDQLELDTIKTVLGLSRDAQVQIAIGDCEVVCPKEELLIMTHQVVDLILATGYRELILLESYTGVTKRRNQWYTKLLRGSTDMLRVPFDRFTIQYVGDSGGMFSSQIGLQRKVLTDCAEKYQWTAATTQERVLLTLGLTNPELAKLARMMYTG